MVPTIALRVTELLCSRLCHELISPVTAVNNGMELFADGGGGDMHDDIVKLVSDSGGQASRRLQFYRIAYGFGGEGAAAPGLADSGKLLRGLLEGGKLVLDWPRATEDGADRIGREATKVLLNAVLVGAEALPRGGTLAIRIGAGPPAAITITATGEGARVTPETVAALAAGADVTGLTACSVQAYFTARLAEAFGGRLDVAPQGAEPAAEPDFAIDPETGEITST